MNPTVKVLVTFPLGSTCTLEVVGSPSIDVLMLATLAGSGWIVGTDELGKKQWVNVGIAATIEVAP